MDWFEKAEDELVEQFNNGEINSKEFNREMNDLRAELREQADQAADEARNSVLGGW